MRELDKLRAKTESIKRLKIKRNDKRIYELANDSNIELAIESKKHIFQNFVSIAKSISNKKKTTKNLRIEPLDSNLENKSIPYCPELPLKTFSCCSYLNIKTMNIIFLDTEISVNKSIANTKDEYLLFNEEYFYHIL